MRAHGVRTIGGSALTGSVRLTAARIAALSPEARDYAVYDETTPGFGVRVYPSGQRRFVFRYRAGKSRSAATRMVTIGDVRKLGLEDARRIARDLAGQVARGLDPSAERRQAEVDRVRKRPFSAVRDDFLSTYVDARLREKSAYEYRRVLGREFAPIEAKPFDEVTRADIAAVIQTVAARGKVRQANVVRAVARKLFSWAKANGLRDDNPVLDTEPAGQDARRERVLSPAELGEVYLAALAIGGPFGAAVRFLMLTGQRRSEALGLRRSEVDAQEKVWRLPKERTKNGRAHDVPLSGTALEIVTEQPQRSDFVFATSTGTPFGMIDRAKKQLDARITATRRERDPEAKALPHWTLHDLRRSFVTHAHDHLGIGITVIERAINHVSGSFGGVVGIYNRATLMKERRAAFNLWETFVLEVAGLSVECEQPGQGEGEGTYAIKEQSAK